VRQHRSADSYSDHKGLQLWRCQPRFQVPRGLSSTCMGNSIDATRGTHRRWESHGKLHVVRHGTRQDLGVTSCCLLSVGCLAQVGGHFAAGVCCWDACMWKPCSNAYCFAQTDGTSATSRYDRVGFPCFCILLRLSSDMQRRVHCCLGEEAREFAFE